tara:strand:- start:2550 stop:2765 length:216 start_codon:yes stop_codon:yes gene_type:complete
MDKNDIDKFNKSLDSYRKSIDTFKKVIIPASKNPAEGFKLVGELESITNSNLSNTEQQRQVQNFISKLANR